MPIRMEKECHNHWGLVVYCDGCGKKIDDLNLAFFAYDTMGPDSPRDIYFCHQYNRCPDLIQNRIMEKAKEENRKHYCKWLHFNDFALSVFKIRLEKLKEKPVF